MSGPKLGQITMFVLGTGSRTNVQKLPQNVQSLAYCPSASYKAELKQAEDNAAP